MYQKGGAFLNTARGSWVLKRCNQISMQKLIKHGFDNNITNGLLFYHQTRNALFYMYLSCFVFFLSIIQSYFFLIVSTVAPFDVKLEYDQGTFTCSSTANPPVMNDQYVITLTSTGKTFACDPEVNGCTKVTCTATNAIGTANGSQVLCPGIMGHYFPKPYKCKRPFWKGDFAMCKGK